MNWKEEWRAGESVAGIFIGSRGIDWARRFSELDRMLWASRGFTRETCFQCGFKAAINKYERNTNGN